MKHPYFGSFILQTLGVWMTAAVASDDVATSTLSVDSSGDTVVGSWRIDFTPNRAIRLYEIRSDGTVVDAVGSIGRLITANLSSELGTGRSPEEHPATQDLVDWRHGRRWYLRFDQDTSGCFELITPTADGRLMVEHFNPSATELPRPDQIGIGERVLFRAAAAPLPTGIQSSIAQPPDHLRIPIESLPTGAIDGFGDTRLRHASPVTCIAVSPDGKWIASGSIMGEQRLWDAETGKLIRTFPDDSRTKVTLAAFSPDGKSLALFKDHLICWNPETGEKKFQFEVEGFPLDICYSPNGTMLAVAARDTEHVVLVDAQTGQVCKRLGGHRRHAISVAFSPDGNLLASVDEAGNLSLHSLQNGSTTTSPNISGKVSFSPDAKRIAVNSGTSMSIFRIEDMTVVAPAEYVVQRGLYADTTPRTARFSNDGTRISWGNVIWDAATGNQLFEHNGMMNGPAEWFPNGERLAASGADGVVRVINASDGETLLPERESSRLFNLLQDVVGRQPQNTWPQPGHLQVQLFSNTTDTIAYVRTQDTHLTIFGTHRSRLPSSGIDHEQKYAYSMDLKWPVKEFQLAENGSKLVALVSNRLEVWRVGAGGSGPQFILQEFADFDALQPDKPYQQLTQFSVSPDGRKVAALITENIIIRPDESQSQKEAAVRQIFKTWSLVTGESTLTRTGPIRRIGDPQMRRFFYAHGFDFSNEDAGSHPRFLATGSATLDDLEGPPEERLFRLIDATDGSHQSHDVRLVSPDSKWMLTESRTGDGGTSEFTVVDFKNPENPVLWKPEGQQFAASHNGQWLACCRWHWDAPATIEIRQADNGALLMSLTGHLGPVNSITFAPDDRSIATAGSDGSTLIWDTTTFGRNTPEAITAQTDLRRTFEELMGDDSQSQYRSLWRYALDDRLTADLAERFSHLLTTARQEPAALELDKIIQRVITLHELRGDEDSVLQLRQFSEDQSLTSEQRMTARQSLSRVQLRFPERLDQNTLSRTNGDESYFAYWLINPEASSTGYRKLLITRGPVERLLQVRFRAPMPDSTSPSTRSPLDEQAFTIDTYQDDSIWGELFQRVDSIGTLNVERSQLVLNEQTYEIQPCPIDVVCRLLENPLGTLPLHRRGHPLHGVEKSVHALALLLKEQLALK